MMVWLDAAALWTLALVAGPVIVHLLRSRRAPRIDFPSLRFVRPATASSVRLRLPSDWLLLILRCTIVGLAACAIAQPLVVTAARLAEWNGRTVRAVIVDTSDSMRLDASPAARAAAQADAVAEAELQGVFAARRVDAPDLGQGLAGAVAWLATAPPARQEIVLISDFHADVFDASDLTIVPPHVGISTIAVGPSQGKRQFDGHELMGAAGIPARRTRVELSPAGTRAVFSATTGEASPGLRVLAGPDQSRDVDLLLRAVAAAGAPSPMPAEPLTIRFSGVRERDDRRDGVVEPWMLRTILRLGTDVEVAQTARGMTASQPVSSAPGDIVVLRDSRRQALVHASARAGSLVLETSADVSSWFAAVLVRAALVARHGSFAQPEQEVRRIDRTTLAAQARAAWDVQPSAWRQAEASDARWCWLAALVLLACEQWLRRTRVFQEVEHRDVAA
jgi:hypothetical protein